MRGPITSTLLGGKMNSYPSQEGAEDLTHVEIRLATCEFSSQRTQ